MLTRRSTRLHHRRASRSAARTADQKSHRSLLHTRSTQKADVSWQSRLAVCNVDGQQPPHGCAAVAFRGAVPPENQSASLLVRVTYCVVLDDTDDDDDDQLRSSWSWCVTEKVRIVHLTLHRRCVTEKARIMYFTQQYH